MLGMGGCQRSPEVIQRRGQGAPAFTFPTQRPTLRRHTCDSQRLPPGTFPSLGAPLPFGPLFEFLPRSPPRDPCPAPSGPAPVGRAARIVPAARGCPALSPRPAGMPPGSPTFPDRPDHRTRCPLLLRPSLGLQDPYSLRVPSRTLRDAPAVHDPGCPPPAPVLT